MSPHAPTPTIGNPVNKSSATSGKRLYNHLGHVIKSETLLNPLVSNTPFLYPLETLENHKVFQFFHGVVKGCVHWEQIIFGQNRAEYRNWRNDITGLQTNRIYCHVNGLKTQRILITSFEHVLMVKPLIYEILLSCHKRHQIFQASKGFSGRFNKQG